MSLLQKAKATALAAESGYYDDNNESESHEKPTATNTAEQQHGQHLPLGEDRGRSDVANSAAAPSTPKPTLKKSNVDLKSGNGDDERSSCSTHPASDRSFGGYGDEDDDDDVRRTEWDTNDTSQGAYRSDAGSVQREGKGAADGNATSETGSNSHTSTQRVLEELTPEEVQTQQEVGELLSAAALTGGCEVRSTTERLGMNGNDEEREAAEHLETLRGMLQRLDCGEWDGSVNTVLDIIEGLSSWIPPPASPDESPLTQNYQNGAGPGLDKGILNPGVDAPLASDNDLDSQEASGRDGGRGEQNHPQGEGGDDDEDEEEEEEEEEVGTDMDAESKGEGEDDDDNDDYYGDKEEEEKGHPLLRERNGLRAQWRRLVLDAQLEPETNCSAFMREEVGIMMDGIIDAMEAVRRETGRAVGGEGTPRGNVLGYDEVRLHIYTLSLIHI